MQIQISIQSTTQFKVYLKKGRNTCLMSVNTDLILEKLPRGDVLVAEPDNNHIALGALPTARTACREEHHKDYGLQRVVA